MRPSRPFPEGSTERLKLVLRRAESKVEFQRVQCVWLRAALGLNANQVAEAIGWQPTSVRRVQAQFLRQGEALWERPGRGGRRHQNLTVEEEARLLQGFLPVEVLGKYSLLKERSRDGKVLEPWWAYLSRTNDKDSRSVEMSQTI